MKIKTAKHYADMAYKAVLLLKVCAGIMCTSESCAQMFVNHNNRHWNLCFPSDMRQWALCPHKAMLTTFRSQAMS